MQAALHPIMTNTTTGLDHLYHPGDRVKVDDGIRRFNGVVARHNPRNSAEYEITDSAGTIWCVHWAYLRRTSPTSEELIKGVRS